MDARKKRLTTPKLRVQTKSKKPVRPENPETAPLDFLPPEIIKMLKNTEYRFSQSEQMMLTLLTQIIVEILIMEEI